MIIRGKNSTSKQQSSSSDNVSRKRNVIKKDDAILDVENAKNTNSKEEIIKKPNLNKEVSKQETFEKIDISSVEFKERIERRRGDRRRGYRRIDERSLVSRAQQEAHNIKELAAREGYKNGISKAQKEIEEIKTSLDEFLSSKDEMYKDFYPHVMEIALEIAKKIIQKEVELSQDVLKNIALSVLDEINSDVQKITFKIHPDDLEFAQASLPESIKQKGFDIKTSFVPDETIAKGSCLIVANNGVIDANFKTQLAILQSSFGIYKGGV